MIARTAALVALLAALSPMAAFAQVPSVAVGQKVTVTNAQGFEFRGAVTAMSSTAVEVLTEAGPQRLPMSDVWMISKKDSNKNGFWIGFAVGALPTVGLTGGRLNSGQVVSFIAFGGLFYGFVGALIDNAIDGRVILYRRPERGSAAVVKISPIVGLDGPRRFGVAGTLTWR